MKPTVQALRALSAIYMQGVLKVIFWVVGVIFALFCLLVSVLSVQVSIWWLLLLVIILPITIILTVVASFLWFATTKLLPRRLSPEEKKTIKAYADKVNGITEGARTPYPIAILLIGKDIVRGRESTFLKRLIDDSGSLKGDFAVIKKLFEE